MPQKEIKPLHISINTAVLKATHKHLQKLIDGTFEPMATDVNLWDYYFDKRRVTKDNRKFEDFILTDGLSASVTLVAAQDARVSASNTFHQAARVVSVDPGRNPIISGVVYNEGANECFIRHSKYSSRKNYVE